MILRTCVVIPCFDNGRTISEAVKDVVRETPFPVLVVDDGSENPVSNVLYSWEVRQALESGRVRVVRFDQNRGKGAALRFAIDELVRRGFTHMFTMDGDGQHYAREIMKLVEVAKTHPWDLIIGDRRLKTESVPEVSRFGRKFSNFWVSYETGLHIKDSQSGFRLYPLFALQMMRFWTRRYDFEIEVLIRLMWRGVHVREVEIDVHYPADRVTHFHKFWDNVRISVLNTILVSVSLFRTHRKPGELAAALGLGVFVGCTPFYGFHWLIVIAAGFLLRLNVIIMWLGTHVSTPLLAPLIVASEVWIGRHWLHVAPENGPKGDFLQWVEGSGVLGTILGLGTALIAYITAYVVQNRKPRSNWTGRARGGRFGNGFLKLVLRHLSLEAGYFCLYFIVPYFYLFAPKAWRGLNEYWKIAEPGLPWRRRQARVLGHEFRFGQVLMDRAYQNLGPAGRFTTRVESPENVQSALALDKGVICLSAHVGAWDLAASLLPARGLSDSMKIVEYRAEGLSFQKIKEGMGKPVAGSLDSGQSGDAIFEIHSALKNRGILGLMGDRPLADRFELIPFFGLLAPFDVTAFRIAAATGSPVLFCFGFKAADPLYEIYARPPRTYLYEPNRARELQCHDWAVEYVREVEHFTRRYPEQWFNFYPFWSSLPTAPNGALAAQSNNHLLEELNRPKPAAPASESDSRPNGGPG
jgi:predicted LPLAT superfamily acyltransferase/uncharacterized protein (DUF2062 family)